MTPEVVFSTKEKLSAALLGRYRIHGVGVGTQAVVIYHHHPAENRVRRAAEAALAKLPEAERAAIRLVHEEQPRALAAC